MYLKTRIKVFKYIILKALKFRAFNFFKYILNIFASFVAAESNNSLAAVKILFEFAFFKATSNSSKEANIWFLPAIILGTSVARISVVSSFRKCLICCWKNFKFLAVLLCELIPGWIVLFVIFVIFIFYLLPFLKYIHICLNIRFLNKFACYFI